MLPLIIGAVVGAGALLLLSSSGSSSSSFRTGPGGRGRIYGQPNVRISDEFWSGSDIMFGCTNGVVWVAEGANFLPTINKTVPPRPTLKPGSAWGFVEFLLDQHLDMSEQANEVDEAAAFLMAQAASDAGIAGLECASQNETSPLSMWMRDVFERVRKYAAMRGIP